MAACQWCESTPCQCDERSIHLAPLKRGKATDMNVGDFEHDLRDTLELFVAYMYKRHGGPRISSLSRIRWWVEFVRFLTRKQVMP